MATTRRDFLSGSTLFGAGLVLDACKTQLAPAKPPERGNPTQPLAATAAPAQNKRPETEKADLVLRIATGLAELADDKVVSTTLYNGQFPGPLVRFREGQRVVADIHNDSDTPELIHWHGQTIPSDVDGAAEEGTPYVPAK